MPLPAKRFYMIRHGETEANKALVMAGSIDSPLTETGRAQARAVHPVLERLPEKPRTIVHSHLSRARDTARIINEVLNVPLHEDPDLAEIHAGIWEGATYAECREHLNSWITPPGGEDVTAFCTRLVRGKSKALNTHEGPVLIVSHGGVFRAFGKLYGLDPPPKFRNCHLHEFIPRSGSTFPWNVFHYDYEDSLTRTRSSLYHPSADDTEPEEMA